MAKAGKKKTQPDIPAAEVAPLDQQAVTQPTAEEIAVRAYHIYLDRGGAEGNSDDDWLQAERDLTRGSE
jgi:hypothetical protein